jgi:hypothetical protein
MRLESPSGPIRLSDEKYVVSSILKGAHVDAIGLVGMTVVSEEGDPTEKQPGIDQGESRAQRPSR